MSIVTTILMRRKKENKIKVKQRRGTLRVSYELSRDKSVCGCVWHRMCHRHIWTIVDDRFSHSQIIVDTILLIYMRGLPAGRVRIYIRRSRRRKKMQFFSVLEYLMIRIFNIRIYSAFAMRNGRASLFSFVLLSKNEKKKEIFIALLLIRCT